jgi:hypothetical protein
VCVLGHHYKAIQWLPLASSVPIELSPEVSVQITKGPFYRHVVLKRVYSFTHSFSTRQTPRDTTQSSLPIGTPKLDSTTYYVRPYPYRCMVVLFSWVDYYMNQSLRHVFHVKPLWAIRGCPVHYPNIHHCRCGRVSSNSATDKATKFVGPHKSRMCQYIIKLAHLGQAICP